MKLTLKELATYVHGAYKITEIDGRLAFSRFDEKQFAVTDKLNNTINNAARTDASITIEFFTDASSIAFDCVFPYTPTDLDTLDVFADGVLVDSFNVDDTPCGGVRLVSELPAGKKRVTLYMPCDGRAEIGDLELDGTFADKVKKRERVMFIGDSITQGYGPYLSSMTYVNCFARLIDCEVFNQGIGGYYYDEKFIMPLDTQKPDMIIVAMGTNQIRSADKAERVKEFYKALDAVYPDVKKLAVTPLWRVVTDEEMNALLELSAAIRATCAEHDIPVVDGFELVPHSKKWFKDGLHPNASGCMLYALNLGKKYSMIRGHKYEY